jgi:hypothetical protein
MLTIRTRRELRRNRGERCKTILMASGGRNYRREWYTRRLAVLIAGVSICGALVVLRASVWFDRAAELDRQTMQQLQLQQSIRTQHESLVLQDLQLFTLYREQIIAAAGLTTQADEIDYYARSRAIKLRDEAFEHLALARSLRLLFRTVRPDLGINLKEPRFHAGCEPGPLSGCVDQVLDGRLASDIRLIGLRPEQSRARSSALHRTSVALVGVAALLALSVLMVSVARLLSLQRMRLLAGCGLAVLSIGVVLYGIAEVGAR